MQLDTLASLLIVLILSTPVASAQIVNVAKLDASKNQGFYTAIELKNKISLGNSEVESYAAKANFQYLKNQHWWLLLVDRQYETVADQLALDRSMQHLRYRYRLFEKIEVESFLQNARDPFKRVESRKLIGLGPRFKILSDYDWFIGLASMHESEATDGKRNQSKQWRASVSMSLDLNLGKSISLDASAYLQPSGLYTNDYRLISDTGVNIRLIEHLSWRISFQTSYDSKPADMVKKFDQKLEQSLNLSF